MLKTFKEIQEKKQENKTPAPILLKNKTIEEEKIKYKLHIPEWERGYYKTFDLLINNQKINIVNNVCYTYDKQIKDELIKQGYLLLQETREK